MLPGIIVPVHNIDNSCVTHPSIWDIIRANLVGTKLLCRKIILAVIGNSLFSGQVCCYLIEI
jgi:hypothetical protein